MICSCYYNTIQNILYQNKYSCHHQSQLICKTGCGGSGSNLSGLLIFCSHIQYYLHHCYVHFLHWRVLDRLSQTKSLLIKSYYFPPGISGQFLGHMFQFNHSFHGWMVFQTPITLQNVQGAFLSLASTREVTISSIKLKRDVLTLCSFHSQTTTLEYIR